MSDYTPTTEEVRGYIARVQGTGGSLAHAQAEAIGLWFDRWLAQVKAEVWDECGQDIHGDHYPDTETYLRNPYREETK